MDDTQGTTPPNDVKPGAPELGRKVKPPSAPPIEDRTKTPIFRAEPTTPAAVNVPPDDAQSAAQNDDAEEEAPPAHNERQARIEYLKSLRQNGRKKQDGKGKKLLIVLLVLVLLGVVGAGAYYFYQKSQSPSNDTKTTDNTSQQKQQSDEQSDQPASTTAEPKDYTSTVFSLSLQYPDDWETPVEDSDKLVIMSPVVKLTDANNQPANGRIVFRIRPKQSPEELKGGNIVAVLESQKENYTKPAAGQRASTYFSYVQNPSTTKHGGLDGIYITGSFGYKYAQEIKLSEIASINPLISVTFVSCSDTTCAGGSQKPLTISSTAWKGDTTNRPAVESLLKSLSIN